MTPVLWSKEARQDYFNILHYVAGTNPFAAERIVDAIEQTGNQLGNFATGRIGRISGTYEKLVPRLPYIIAYAVTADDGGKVVSILRVIHTSRNWPVGEWPE